MKNLLTLVVTTSHVPSAPSTEMIDRSIGSALESCEDARILIMASAPNGHESYAEYLKRLQRRYSETLLIADDPSWHQAGKMRRFFHRIQTPFMLFWEHDWEIIKPVPVCKILESLVDPVKFIRLNKRNNIVTGYDRELEKHDGAPVPLLATSCLSTNPHFARTETYRDFILPMLSDGNWTEPQIMESPGGGSETYNEGGLAGFTRKFGAFIFGNLNDPPAVRHLDGRTFCAS